MERGRAGSREKERDRKHLKEQKKKETEEYMVKQIKID